MRSSRISMSGEALCTVTSTEKSAVFINNSVWPAHETLSQVSKSHFPNQQGTSTEISTFWHDWCRNLKGWLMVEVSFSLTCLLHKEDFLNQTTGGGYLFPHAFTNRIAKLYILRREDMAEIAPVIFIYPHIWVEDFQTPSGCMELFHVDMPCINRTGWRKAWQTD